MFLRLDSDSATSNAFLVGAGVSGASGSVTGGSPILVGSTPSPVIGSGTEDAVLSNSPRAFSNCSWVI